MPPFLASVSHKPTLFQPCFLQNPRRPPPKHLLVRLGRPRLHMGSSRRGWARCPWAPPRDPTPYISEELLSSFPASSQGPPPSPYTKGGVVTYPLLEVVSKGTKRHPPCSPRATNQAAWTTRVATSHKVEVVKQAKTMGFASPTLLPTHFFQWSWEVNGKPQVAHGQPGEGVGSEWEAPQAAHG